MRMSPLLIFAILVYVLSISWWTVCNRLGDREPYDPIRGGRLWWIGQLGGLVLAVIALLLLLEAYQQSRG
jgi:hypothetical protein